MKRRILNPLMLLSLACLLAVATTKVHAQNDGKLYVYALDGEEQVFVLDEIQKITFTEDNMIVQPVSGNTTELGYSDLSKMTFRQQGDVANEIIETENGVKVYPDGNGSLIVESATEILAVNLFDLQGKLLQSAAPQSLTATLDMSSALNGVYVVQILNRQGVSAHKIVKQ